jgi:uncharacterized protein YegP (UPF0339 family)
MPDPLTIPKSTSSFPQYLDWSLLREAGIKHLEQLGSDLWTDYNLHDPGITILEVLCYALTDLGYRTNFDMKDLLARSQASKNSEKKTSFGLPFDDNFFTAAEVLSCNPVTIDDFRKLLLNIAGVRNAWLEPAPDGELPIYFNRKQKKLQFHLPDNGTEQLDRIRLKGLYDICLELEPLLVRDACGNKFFSKEGILEKVYETLNIHRNLCEDFRDIMVFGEEQIAVCADIELASTAVPEDVLLEIYKQVESFLSPSLPFYTLQEMLQKGRRVEDIFEGRPLTVGSSSLVESHGFIDTADLKKLEPKYQLYTSDLYRVIMGVEGVIAIHNLALANAIDKVAMTSGEKWCLELTPKYRPHFNLELSQVTFFKGVLPFVIDKKTVEQRYLEEKAASLKALLDPYQLDLPIPEGKYIEMEEYLSITEEFPLTYGIGEEGIKGSPDARRKGQAKQMKGYLLFYDQLLVNYLAQLAHVRDLFSIRPDEERNGKTHTYFTHLLKEVPGIADLVKNYNECEGNDLDGAPPEDFPSYLDYIAESIETYHDRRNRFLDHLLARFSESFSDYVLLMFEISGKQQQFPKIIQDKADFLKSYPEISRNRGKGFDYSKPVGCIDLLGCSEDNQDNTENDQASNVSGLEKRVSKLIGIDKTGWLDLALGNLKATDAGWMFRIKYNGEEMVSSKSAWSSQEEACLALDSWQAFFGEEKYYRRLSFEVVEISNDDGDTVRKEYHSFFIVNEEEECIAESLKRYSDLENCEAVIHWLISRVQLPGMDCAAIMETECYEFHLFDYSGEKLLLRGKHGFQTPMDAMAFFDMPENEEDFMGWAVQPGNYEKTENEGLFSFFLKNNVGENVAVHPHGYPTEQECDDRLQAVIYYLDNDPPLSGVDGTPGTFGFIITDAARNELFTSTGTYPTQKEARSAAWLVRMLARHRVYYHLLENPETRLPYGFELFDRSGNPIAEHPIWYATDCERDLAVDVIIYCSENIDTRHRIIRKNDSFYFVLENPDGSPLMKGLFPYPDTNTAEAAWEAFINRAMFEENYRLTNLEGAEYPFGCELVDIEDKALASLVRTYATEAESEMAMRAVLNYVCNTEWLVEMTGDFGEYHFWLDSTAGKRLLDSVVVYPDEPSARMALQSALQLAKESGNFFYLKKFGFRLQDAEGNILASHPHLYASESEREAAINLIVNYVRSDAPRIEILNTGGAFRATIFNEYGEAAFAGDKLHPNTAGALAELEQFFLLAASSANYKRVDDGHQRCPYGFQLLDEEGMVVARHPLHYPSSKERDRIMMSVFAWLTNGEKLTDEVITQGEKFSFELKDFSGQVFLKAKYGYATEEKAKEIWLQVVEAINNPDNFRITYNNAKCLYNAELLVNGSVMAVPPGPFHGRIEAREWIDLLKLIIQIDPIRGEATGTECGFYFHLQHSWPEESDENDINIIELRGVNHYASSSGALRACHQASTLLGNDEFFKAIETNGKWQLSLVNEIGVQVAFSLTEYDDETKALEVRDHIRDLLVAGGELSCENPDLVAAGPEVSKFYIRISHKGNVLLDSLQYSAAEEAWEHSNEIHEISHEQVRYNLITNREECLFSFELSDKSGLPVATHPIYYTTMQERDEAIQRVMQYLNTEGMHLVENILLRPFRIGMDQSFYFELIDNQQKIALLQSMGKYLSGDEAWAAMLKMWEALWHHGHGEIGYVEMINDAEGPCKYSFKILAGSGIEEGDSDSPAVLAMPLGPCFSEENRDKLLETLVSIVKDLEVAPVELPELPKPYHAMVSPLRLKDEVEGCQLMTPVLEHLVPGITLPAERYDPYSFRATVVLPYWPENFQKPEFRAFVETTLRQEAPAHVFLRICWVDTRQMKEFEEAYCHWLSAKTDGEDSCGASAAKNRLIDILCSLRSIYPGATLHDCNLPTKDSNRVVLNYSILGSANTSNHVTY